MLRTVEIDLPRPRLQEHLARPEAVRLEQELLSRAFRDPLTELPNRALLRERLEQALLNLEHSPSRVAGTSMSWMTYSLSGLPRARSIRALTS